MQSRRVVLRIRLSAPRFHHADRSKKMSVFLYRNPLAYLTTADKSHAQGIEHARLADSVHASNQIKAWNEAKLGLSATRGGWLALGARRSCSPLHVDLACHCRSDERHAALFEQGRGLSVATRSSSNLSVSFAMRVTISRCSLSGGTGSETAKKLPDRGAAGMTTHPLNIALLPERRPACAPKHRRSLVQVAILDS